MAKAKEKILQLKIQLRDSKPPIWRRVLVKESTLLGDLHIILQVIMGWTDSHLHMFLHNGQEYGPFYPDDDYNEDIEDLKNEDHYTVRDFLKRAKAKMVYIYDFGDDWTHEIILEGTEKDCKEPFLPACITGEKACPPEDCGGISGFYRMLSQLEDKESEDYEEIRDWLGEDFNPDFFDIKKINKSLKKIFKG